MNYTKTPISNTLSSKDSQKSSFFQKKLNPLFLYLGTFFLGGLTTAIFFLPTSSSFSQIHDPISAQILPQQNKKTEPNKTPYPFEPISFVHYGKNGIDELWEIQYGNPNISHLQNYKILGLTNLLSFKKQHSSTQVNHEQHSNTQTNNTHSSPSHQNPPSNSSSQKKPGECLVSACKEDIIKWSPDKKFFTVSNLKRGGLPRVGTNLDSQTRICQEHGGSLQNYDFGHVAGQRASIAEFYENDPSWEKTYDHNTVTYSVDCNPLPQHTVSIKEDHIGKCITRFCGGDEVNVHTDNKTFTVSKIRRYSFPVEWNIKTLNQVCAEHNGIYHLNATYFPWDAKIRGVERWDSHWGNGSDVSANKAIDTVECISK